jgi:NAD(P)-dependent dehydrogenase (short-subunit alcohol dehydrogenase family)
MDMGGIGAVVTGASRGLGAALARELAARGARVAMVARSEAELGRVVADIREAGGAAHAIPADVGDKESTYKVAGIASALVGPVELLVNNASLLGRVPLVPLLDTECEDLSSVLEVNVVGPFRLAKALLGSMVLRGRGLLVDVTSDASVAAYPTWGAYGLSKAALDHMGRIWAAELAGTGVRVLTVDPGEMKTRMHADAIPDADPATLADPRDVARRIVAMIAQADSLPTGARVEVSSWTEAR